MEINTIVELVNKAQSKYVSSIRESVEIIEDIKKYVENNFELLKQAYRIDKKDELSLEKLMLQFGISEIEKSEAFKNEYGKVGNMMVPYGILGVISDCDVYNILRIIVLGIQTKNGLIINITDNVGTNFILIDGVKKVLEKYELSNLIEIYNNKAGENLEENEKINGIIYIGKKANADRMKILTTKPLIYSGCGNYELYIEDNLDDELMEKIKDNKKFKIYSNIGIGIGQEVKSKEEAMIRISETGNGYAVGIITSDRESAKEFVDKINAKNVFVNALPSLVNDNLDIAAQDLMYKKSVLVYDNY